MNDNTTPEEPTVPEPLAVKDDPVAELMRLVETYGSACAARCGGVGREYTAVEACARKLVAAHEPLTWPPILDSAGPPVELADEVMAEQPCFCNGDISLQSVAGGAHETGLYGTVWLRIGGQVVEYVRKASWSAVVSEGVKP